ncbi:ABC transporter substrate-binding protein [Curvibacter sp. HBC61]|uniref:ABC transporter substrate-binding protein n=1 Tax=Curvibacter cyanobacteriorum TaxID=3026422 RepID=A0ABT5N1J3_9BURK|nr:ABC transporter substrate-binding protein [Curvibacter sp. HBC61]MDD0840183.1 ABC transporter substrate-binding protein [Curvibacter sp. HBC61]
MDPSAAFKAPSRRRFAWGTAALLAAPGLVRAEADRALVLGQSVALTGPAAQLGLQYVQGAQLLLERVNARGGVARRPLTLRILDDGYEADRCADNTRRLIQDEVFALFGYVGTPTSLAALPLATQARLPFVAPLSGAGALREPFNRQVFHVRASYDAEAELIVSDLVRRGHRRVGVLLQNDAFGQSGLLALTRALQGAALRSVAQATVERNSLDVATAVRTLVVAQPDAMVLACTYQASAAFVRASRKAGYTGTFHNVSFVGTQPLARALGPEGAGVVISQVVPSPHSATHALSQGFRQAVLQGGNRVQLNHSSLEGYLAAAVLVEGLKAAARQGPLSREGLVEGLESLGQRQVVGFPISLSRQNHQASRFVELSTLLSDGSVQT